MKSVLKVLVRDDGTPDEPKLVDWGHRQLWFMCKACQLPHAVNVALPGDMHGKAPLWSYDGQAEKPTISPSVRCWSNGARGTPDGDSKTCHFNLVDGVQQFHGDTWPEVFRGQHHPLEDVPTWLVD